MTTENLLMIVAIVLLVSALPLWPYSRQWGYGPTGVLGLVLVCLIAWALYNNSEGRSVGNDIQDGVEDAADAVKDGARDAADGIKDLGRDVKDSVQDAVK